MLPLSGSSFMTGVFLSSTRQFLNLGNRFAYSSNFPRLILEGSRLFSHSTRTVFNRSKVNVSFSPSWRLYSILQRRFGSIVKAPLGKEEFFNRRKEIAKFRDILRGNPQLSIISGPVDSGKTTLIMHILREISEEENRPIFHLDLRGTSFVTVNEFATFLEEEFQSWFSNAIAGVELKTPFGDVKIQSGKEPKSPIEKFNAIFKDMTRQLPDSSFWKGKLKPILFIDEANKLNRLLKDKDGEEALTTLFDWLVKNTKQENRFHVVMASSDSFFHLWVKNRVGVSRFESYVIGHLSRQEAERFWNERILRETNTNEVTPLPKFEDAYQACGSNIFFLQKYFAEYRRSKATITPNEFSLVLTEKNTLMNAYWNGSTYKSTEEEKKSAKWTREQFMSLLEKLICAKDHFLVYDELCGEMGKDVVSAFISSNIIHLRLTVNYNYDISGHPKDKAIVTAETPASLLAMKKILKVHTAGKYGSLK